MSPKEHAHHLFEKTLTFVPEGKDKNLAKLASISTIESTIRDLTKLHTVEHGQEFEDYFKKKISHYNEVLSELKLINP